LASENACFERRFVRVGLFLICKFLSRLGLAVALLLLLYRHLVCAIFDHDHVHSSCMHTVCS
jgi:hypothetical protein